MAATGAVTGASAQDAAAPANAPAAPKATKSGGGGDSDLRRRVQQLEEQIVDMQVVIGTLESLARSGGAAPSPRVVAPVGGGGADAARIDALDMQVRALTSQIEQLQSGRGSVGAAPPAYSAAPAQPPAASTFGSTTLNAG
jgi:TolA-binding protein